MKLSHPRRTVTGMTEPTDAQLLELAGRDYRLRGSLENAVHEAWGLSSTQFWARVWRVVDRPEPELAREFAPLIARLLRLREVHRRQRLPRRRAG